MISCNVVITVGPSHYECCPYKRREFRYRYVKREGHVKKWGGDSHLWAKDRSLRREELCQNFHLIHLSSRTTRKYISACKPSIRFIMAVLANWCAMYCLNFRSGGKMMILLGLHPNITISAKEPIVFSVDFSLKGNLPPSSKKLLERFLSDLINLISAVCSVHWDKYQEQSSGLKWIWTMAIISLFHS